jgi:hypothetical protein
MIKKDWADKAALHKASSGAFNSLAECLEKCAGLSKSSKSDMDGKRDELAKCLQKGADDCKEHAAWHDREHEKAMTMCAKADESDDLNKSGTVADLVKRLTALENTVQPTNVSAVAPDRFGLRAVPRYGQQPIPERPNVPVEFEKLVAIEG